ncbi:putative MgsA AAA+ ATPase C terminal [Monocercomonoides exilis]|uniref:putative MgsA AAA+ ATPase C terminal n=1 Tax=Monocercomonoides exilis TaxID=2049356 RepID=UPI00355A5A1F|nr:putative MgsA AAA+ ATPase C terminal [Monocercomonoides exilis]|eukprot:MONOS_5373.1-p1 / transcript=MONOS_5373.1 / gene=MONOS_5373 / organism=Monocercomonoides_exilis_PA203 / gene_product=unspecified product / transcript_product=unspecified product / location=Mono_scaffold00155:73188-75446(-) / protein_length=715 / sequence_SO=supercontig / SO=protein_coding / is_pseudo=false
MELNAPKHSPLAALMRPQTLQQFFGQEEIIGDGKTFSQLLHCDAVPSVIFWGPPGTGKTTLAHIIAMNTRKIFVTLSGVKMTLDLLRSVCQNAQKELNETGVGTILFIDEIHRLDAKLQNELVKPFQSGIISIIGATTENPSFHLKSRILNHCEVFHLHELSRDNIIKVLNRGLEILSSLQVAQSTVEVVPFEISCYLEKLFDLPNIIKESEDSLPMLYACPECHCVEYECNHATLQAVAERCNGDCRSALGMLEQMANQALLHHHNTVDKWWQAKQKFLEQLDMPKNLFISCASEEPTIEEENILKGIKQKRTANDAKVIQDNTTKDKKIRAVDSVVKRPLPANLLPPILTQSSPTTSTSSNSKDESKPHKCTSPYHFTISLSCASGEGILLTQSQLSYFDRTGEYHYDYISALHKSVRGGDDNASMYYLAQQLQGGEQRKYITRRAIRMSIEDIGMASPESLVLGVATWKATNDILPEKNDVKRYETNRANEIMMGGEKESEKGSEAVSSKARADKSKREGYTRSENEEKDEDKLNADPLSRYAQISRACPPMDSPLPEFLLHLTRCPKSIEVYEAVNRAKRYCTDHPLRPSPSYEEAFAGLKIDWFKDEEDDEMLKEKAKMDKIAKKEQKRKEIFDSSKMNEVIKMAATEKKGESLDSSKNSYSLNQKSEDNENQNSRPMAKHESSQHLIRRMKERHTLLRQLSPDSSTST